MNIGTVCKTHLKAIFGVFLLLIALTTFTKAQVVTGVDTLNKVSGVWEYYDFTSSKAFTIADTATYTPDFWGSSNEGVNFGKEFSSLIPEKRLYLLGIGNIDTVKTVPTWTDAAPWVDTSWDFTNGTQGQPITPGQLWVVYSSEGLYAVMQIDDLPGGNFGDSFAFKFKYMSEGGTTLVETNLNGGVETGGEIAGSAVSNGGTGFDLSQQSGGELEDAGDYLPDFVFVNNEGVNFGNEGSTSLSTTGRRFILLGTGNIDTVKSVPLRQDAAPWVTVSYDFSDGTQGQPISVGQLWGVYTREGNYAVMEITSLPGGNFGSSFDFKYKYQPDGTRFFDGSGTVDPDPVYSISIESGNNQSMLPETVAPEFLKVLVVDENLTPVQNEIINFSVFDEPIGVPVSANVASSGTTNESGIAQTFVKTGSEAGIYTIKAELASDTSKYVFFTVTAEDTSSSGNQILGTTTINSGNGFDFSRQELADNNDAGDFLPDFVFVNNEGVNFGNEGSTSLSTTGRRFILLGTGNIDSVKSVPVRQDVAPWVTVSYDFSDGTQGQPISVGQLWGVYTREGNYAVMEITSLPGGNFGSSFEFKYKYQPDGTRFFEGSVVEGPQPTTLVISGEVTRTEVLGDTISTPFEVIVLDDIGEPINGITVTFEEIEIPDGAISGEFFTPDGININKAATFNNRAYMDYSVGDKPGDYLIKAFLAEYPTVDSVLFTVSGELLKSPAAQSASGPGIVTLYLVAAEGAVSYNIYRSQGDDNPASASLLASTSDLVYEDKAVTPGETYFYWLKSVDKFGNESESAFGPLMATPTEVPDIVSGTATVIIDEGWQYFDFSTQSTSNQEQNGSFIADFRGTSNEGVNFGREGAPTIEGNRIILLSGDGLSSIVEIPVWTNEAPWIGTTWEWPNGTGGQPISVGQLWGVYTSEGHYAAMEITEVPEAFGSSFSFSYIYQPDGTNTFGELVPLTPDSLFIVSGNDQTANPNATLSQPLMVQVVDESGLPAEGVTVNFNITNIPSGAMGGGLNASSAITTSKGVARVVLTLGDRLGNYEVTATVEGLDPVIFTASAIETPAPDPVTMLEIRDGFVLNSLQPIWTQSNSDNFLMYRLYMKTLDGDFMKIDSTRIGASFRQDTGRVVNGLTELQEYTFAVTVVNADLQESALSNALSGFPKPIPSAPQNFTAVSGDGAIQLTWSPLDTAYFDFYELFVRDNEGFLVSRDSIFSATDTSIVVGGLTNEVEYQFVLNGVNTFGRGGEAVFVSAMPLDTFEEVETTLPSLINGTAVWADVDNDGDLDVLITGQADTSSEPETFLYLNDGAGNLSDSQNTIIGVINSNAYWYDIDQNGYSDLIISGESESGPVTKIYLNEEGTLMDAGVTLPGFGDGMIVPGDYDSDGDLDFLVAGDAGSGPQTVLIQNTGAGTYIPVQFPFVGFTKAAAAWGDYNSDGKLDFIISGEVDGGSIITMLYRNVGNNSFIVGESSLQGVINGTVAFTDLDLDSDLDIIITGFTNNDQTTSFTGLYTNTGLDFDLFYSSTSEPRKALATGKVKRNAVLGDYDNDGDTDVLISSVGSASILKNNRGSIEDVPLKVGAEGSVTWADYDGDGDLDIIASGIEGGSSIIKNTTSIRNSAPTVPKDVFVEVVSDTVKLSWTASTDLQTPSASLTYNVRIGTTPGGSEIQSANADLFTGKLRSQVNGNAGFKTEFILRNLPNGKYYWQVQAVDNGFLSSMFTAESEFEVLNSAVSNEVDEELPSEFALKQNYPNPFNPTTNIQFSIPKNGLVKLEVYDITGRVISSLVNEVKSAGSYQVAFDARNLASGLYIYRLQVTDKVITKKMTLIK